MYLFHLNHNYIPHIIKINEILIKEKITGEEIK